MKKEKLTWGHGHLGKRVEIREKPVEDATSFHKGKHHGGQHLNTAVTKWFTENKDETSHAITFMQFSDWEVPEKLLINKG